MLLACHDAEANTVVVQMRTEKRSIKDTFKSIPSKTLVIRPLAYIIFVGTPLVISWQAEIKAE